MTRHWFVTGTDTGVGKTYITTGLLGAFARLGYRVAGMKPVAAGVDSLGMNEDVAALMGASAPGLTASDLNPYTFRAPTAPDFAAALEQRTVQWSVLDASFKLLSSAVEIILVEGVGGWCVPLNRPANLWQADLAARWNLPVLLVAGIKLGAINHTLLTAESIARKGCLLRGWVANIIDPDYAFAEETISLLQSDITAPCLGVIPWQSSGAPDDRQLSGLTAVAQQLEDRAR